MIRMNAGTALRLLSLPLAIGLLAACGQQSAPAKAEPVTTAKSEIDEVGALVAATKQHPSLVNAAKDAGPPIHVDPFPKSNGMAAHHEHASK